MSPTSSVAATLGSAEVFAHGVECSGLSRREVRTDRDTYDADNLVVAAGAWAGQHLDLFSDALIPRRRMMAWLHPTDPKQFRPSNFPVFSVDVTEGSFYGFPVTKRPGFKFSQSADAVLDPPQLARSVHSALALGNYPT